MREAEEPYLDAGIPLMERAAHGLAEAVGKLLGDSDHAGARILALAGGGNNGADTLFACAELAADGCDVQIARTASRIHAAGLAAALDAGARLLDRDADEPDRFIESVSDAAGEADVVLDGILGTGTSADPALRGLSRDVVRCILPVLRGDGRPAVVAVDIPSGIDPTTGAAPDDTVLPADLTVTFAACKTGLLREPGRGYAGEIVVVDIGIGEELERVARSGRYPAEESVS
ncbi:hypothetical protein GCM10027416_28140 [Okibacterium endophyticum]